MEKYFMRFIGLMKKIGFSLLILLLSNTCLSQDFEGVIVYHTTPQNPDDSKQFMTDSIFRFTIEKVIGAPGYITETWYCKKGQYFVELSSEKVHGYILYDQKTGLIYSWEKGSDTAKTNNSKKYLNKIVSIKALPGIDTIQGIACKSILVKTVLGEKTIWYQPDILKIDYRNYSGFEYNNMEAILKETGSYPVKIAGYGYNLPAFERVLTSFKQKRINSKRFRLPKFTFLSEDPLN